MLIGGLQKSSLIDYPEKISTIIFTQGCNFKCPYCHNPELTTVNSERETERCEDAKMCRCVEALEDNHASTPPRLLSSNKTQILDFLKSRMGKLDGVVITGGEPTLHKELPQFIEQINNLGFLVKLDTNGTNPDMLNDLIEKKLIDYVAMDIKAPIEKYSEIVCSEVNTENILKSIEILKKSSIDFEFRTTVIKSQLLPADFEKIGELIQGTDKYYLQKFVPTKTLDKSFMTQETYSDEEFILIIKNLKKYVKQVELR